MTDEACMKKALDLARRGLDRDEVPVGAVVVKDGSVIGRGYNTRIGKKDPLGHAEIMAIEKASRKLKDFRLAGCDIFVTVEPCILCLGAILQSRIKRVVFGCKNEQEGALCLLSSIKKDIKMNYGLEVKGPFMQQQAGDLMRTFFKTLRR